MKPFNMLREMMLHMPGILAISTMGALCSYADPIGADATVLVNSASAYYQDFQHFIEPYLDNFGVPYVVQDVATNPVGTNISRTALIIIGHRQFDTNHQYLDAAGQANLSAAVSNGVGLVSFDNDLSVGGASRYQFVQDVFGFTYSASGAGSSVTLPPTEPGARMHYITSLRTNNESLLLKSSLTLPGLALPTNAAAVAVSGGKPLVVVRRFGSGRAVQWATYGWMVTPVLGAVSGLDDLVWRGFVWAARKPFVMRPIPNFVTVRFDDCAGPFDWVHSFNAFGFKPFVSEFISSISASSAADLRALCLAGNATASPHAYEGVNLLYFNYGSRTNLPDNVVSNNLFIAKQFHITNGIPMSKMVATHYSDIGWNALQGLLNWGIEYIPMEVDVGATEYSTPYPPWLIAGPYRLYETPGQAIATNSSYYADFLPVAGHPEFNGKFFNCSTKIRDATLCSQWCPNNSIPDSINQGTAMLKRPLDSRVLATLFSHEFEVNNNVSGSAFFAMVQGIATNLAPYQPMQVTLDYGCQYARALKTSRLISCTFEPGTGELVASWTGKTDLNVQVEIYSGDPPTNVTVTVPVFTNAFTSSLAFVPVPPQIQTQPLSRTNHAQTPALFTVSATGAQPAYQWLKDTTAISQATNPSFLIPSVSFSDAAGYTVTVSNQYGNVTSATATLSIVPALTFQPVRASDGSIGLSWGAIPGNHYTLQQKTNLRQSNWVDLPIINAADFLAGTNLPSGSTQSFYRIRVAP
jgi:hypothetical protein